MAKPASGVQPKPARWVGSSKEDLRDFPTEVRRRVGGALWDAQLGLKAPYAKPLKGFGGAGVLEIVDDFDGDTYRAVYTVRFRGVVYVGRRAISDRAARYHRREIAGAGT